jgi:hypothetical protein
MLVALLIVLTLPALVVPAPASAVRPESVPGQGRAVGWSPVHPGQRTPFDGPEDIQTAGAGIPDAATLEALSGSEADGSGVAAELAVAIPTPTSIDMKVLVIHTGDDFEVPGITGALSRIGIPFDELDARTETLVPARLFDATGHGNYYAVILSSGNLLYDAGSAGYLYGFDQDEWDLLWAYEAAFRVRQVTSFTAPIGFPETYGLAYVGEMDTTQHALEVTLTDAGKRVFSYLTGTPIPIRNAWVYLAKVAEPSVMPLIASGDHAIASVKAYPDGRENLAVTAGKNDWSLHSLLLWSGIIDWVTRGVYLGERRVNFDPQVDDLLIDDDIWDPTALSDETGLTYRMTGADFNAAIAWQRALGGAFPVAAGVRLEMAFNGEGATGIYPGDTLTGVVRSRNAAFSWVNHAYSHLNMDVPTTYAQALADIQANHRMAVTLRLSNYAKTAFVQPDISGLENPAFLRAAADSGIRYLISDTSRSGWGNPSPNTGIVLAAEPRLLVVPRRPTNLFYNLATPEQWVSEYNCYYGPDATCAGGAWKYWDHDLTYDEILDVESDMLLSYLLKWDIDPVMFHQANLAQLATGSSLLADLLDTTFAKYARYVTLPVRGMTQEAIGKAMLERMAYERADLTATIVPCTSLTLSAPADVTVPVTGIYVNKKHTETYGDDFISRVNLTAGVARTFTVSCAP